ncbi:DUF547 domain-containing protein [Marinomonas mediterranea]|uniref:DUF547 domain-containing protein n=1 Tax=Marinomonas mediterranea TaxID=119864 RepID=UPI00234B8A46|nr:DUF547 domain-containing protein [Marinomonas mediterranea]WCN10964.1 DUF547 domain-containing protein [Marinomonas mediterranea]WCN15026.1 DUF547 domain-containing protein [Marinomonas mediterranea]
MRTLCSLLMLCLLMPITSMATNVNHDEWNRLLNAHVVSIRDGHSTEVDYQGFDNDRPQLTRYLNSLSAVSKSDFDQWPLNAQLAFLINAYNAWTVELILTEWPDLDSIKDIGGFFSNPWKRSFIPLFGEQVSLDDIEHKMIRGWGRYNDPRIHFAVNCASIGCPALLEEAYTSELLETQLESQTQRFLADDSRNRASGNTLELSSIFKWYKEDFEKGWMGYTSLFDFLASYQEALHLTDEQQRKLSKHDLEIDYLSYNWALNSTN